MSSEMLSAGEYLSIVNEVFVEVSGEPDELKGSRPVRWGAVGNTGYAVRWPPILLNSPPLSRKPRHMAHLILSCL